jgi:hypothetical protein
MMKTYPLLMTASLLLTLTAHAAVPAAFDPGLPPPVVAKNYYDTAKKVVIQMNTGPSETDDIQSFYLKQLNNIENYYQAVKQVSGEAPDIRVVIHGEGIGLLTNALKKEEFPKLAGRIDDLKSKGVKFLICYNTLLGKKITVSQLHQVAPEDFVLAGVAELARLQGMDYRYIKL